METERVWGVERTWPDGHAEIQEYGSRKVAEDQSAPCVGDRWTGEVVYQDVQRTSWRKVSETLDRGVEAVPLFRRKPGPDLMALDTSVAIRAAQASQAADLNWTSAPGHDE